LFSVKKNIEEFLFQERRFLFFLNLFKEEFSFNGGVAGVFGGSLFSAIPVLIPDSNLGNLKEFYN